VEHTKIFKRKDFLKMGYMDKIQKSINFNQNKPIREIVYECLKENIIQEVIPVGERIIEKTFAEKLNISRTPIRDALKRLEQEELLENVSGRGLMVKKITINEVDEIYMIRLTLEVLAAKKAMENITESEISEIEVLLDLTEEKNKEGEVKEVIRLFAEFNEKIYEASRMKRLASMITKLKEYHQRFRDISMIEYKRREEGLREHREIFRAIAEKNDKDIEDIIKRHLNFSYELVVTELSK